MLVVQGRRTSSLRVRLSPESFHLRGDNRSGPFDQNIVHSKHRGVRVSLCVWAFSVHGLTVNLILLLHGHPNYESFAWSPGQDHSPLEQCITRAHSLNVSVGSSMDAQSATSVGIWLLQGNLDLHHPHRSSIPIRFQVFLEHGLQWFGRV